MAPRIFRFYQRHRIVNVNLNIIGAGLLAVAIAKYPVHLLSLTIGEQHKFINSVVAAVVDGIVDIGLYFVLHWIANHWGPIKHERKTKAKLNENGEFIEKSVSFWRDASLVQFERPLTRDRRCRELDLQVVHVVAVLVADEQRVAEALGGDEAAPAELALDQRVGDQRRRVHDRRGDLRGSDTRLGEQLGDAGAHPVERSARGGQRLVHHDAPAGRIEENDIGERAADVDGESPIRGGHQPSFRSSRGGANTSRIQHSSNSSSPMNTLSPCQTERGAR